MQRKLYLLEYLGMDDILKYCSGWLHMEIKGEKKNTVLFFLFPASELYFVK